MQRPLLRPLGEYNPFWLGLVACAVIAAIVLAALGFGLLGLGKDRYTAEFANAGGIRPGNEVRVAGMGVGEVTGAKLEGDHVLVSFRIESDVELGADVLASIKLGTLLGGRYLELRPSATGSPKNNRIPLAHTSVPYDLSNVLEQATPLTEQLDEKLLHQAMDEVNKNLRGDGPKVAAALDGLGRLTDVVNSRREQIGKIIRSTDTLVTLADQRSDRLFALLGQTDTLLKALVSRRDLIRGLLSDLASLTDELRGLLKEDEPKFGPLLDNIVELSDLLKKSDSQIDHALELLAPASRYTANAFGNGPFWDVHLPYSIFPDDFLCAVGFNKGCK